MNEINIMTSIFVLLKLQNITTLKKAKTIIYYQEPLNGGDDKENLVMLDFGDHLKVHTLLPFFTKGKSREKMLHAWHRMSNCRGRIIDSYEEYAYLREERCKVLSEALSGKGNPFWGKKHTTETRKILSEKCANKGEANGMFGVHRFGDDNPMFGKSHSKTTKQKMSKLKKGKKWVFNENEETNKLVLPEEVKQWVSNGWNPGRKLFNKIKKDKNVK